MKTTTTTLQEKKGNVTQKIKVQGKETVYEISFVRKKKSRG